MSLQALEIADDSQPIACRCGATVRLALNYGDGARPLSVQVWHADDCAGSRWADYPKPGEVITGDQLSVLVVPPESAEEYRERIVALVDSGQCDPKCLFAVPESFQTCDCKCEGAHHGAMRWVDR